MTQDFTRFYEVMGDQASQDDIFLQADQCTSEEDKGTLDAKEMHNTGGTICLT